MVEQAREALGGLDILVNNAAEVGARGDADTLLAGDDALLQSDFDTKVKGYVRAARAAAPGMVAQGWGRIVLISGLATRTVTGVSGGLRNAAVTNLGAVLASELGPHGITVNTIQPGAIETETLEERLRTMAERQGMSAERLREQVARANAIQRIVTADEVAEVVVFLASPRAAAVTGESIAVSGGSRSIHY
jgi:NAD(P)-dependent dehydrogenase (short-subunit alcohol dehydrogenase family)